MSLAVFALIISFVVSTIPVVPVSAQEETPIWWDEMVPMRDGVRLFTRIFLPDPDVWGPGPYPTIVLRSPYGLVAHGTLPIGGPFGEAFQGYAYVYQDIRGRFFSEGVNRLFYDEGLDGYDTIEWIASQPWSNGKVGIAGGSAMGITTYLAAGERPPHLVAAAAYVASANLYNDLVYDGGALRFADAMIWTIARVLSGMSESHMLTVVPPPQWPLIPEYIMDAYEVFLDMTTHMSIIPPNRPVDSEWFMHLPLKGFHPNISILQPFIDEILSHPSEDDFRNHLKVYDTIDIPMMHIGGWYDFFARSTVDAFVTLQNKGNQKLFMGPADHGHFWDPVGYWVPYDPYYAWFDYWLKGVDTGIVDEPPVVYYTLGAEEWRYADQWPVGGIEYTNYYLHSDGTLSTDPPAVGEEPESYIYDPMDPVLTWGGRNLVLPKLSRDQRPVEAGRDDILIYTTEILTEDVEVTGPIEVFLSASSNATDTDFTAKLIDVHPDGSAMLVIDNIIRARYRKSMRKPHLMKPGHIYKFTIDMGDISYVFKAGHKIQVDISSSNFPKHDRNLNTGGTLYTETEEDILIANNTIYHDAEHPSYIVLPVMPPKPRVFEGSAKIEMENEHDNENEHDDEMETELIYEGPAELHIYEKAVYLHFEDQWIKWTIKKYWQVPPAEFYKCKGELGKLRVVVSTDPETGETTAIAKGPGIYFSGTAA